MTRESVSRPTWSVPKYECACASGALFIRAKFVLSGSFGAIHGAASAITMIAAATSAPMIDNGFRRANWASSRATDRSLATYGISATATAVSGVMPSEPDPGIEPRVGHVHEDVHHHEDRGIEQHEVLHHDDVALDDRGDERAAEPRDAERLLDRHGSSEDEAQEHARDRDDRQERVRQRVAQHDGLLVRTLGA